MERIVESIVFLPFEIEEIFFSIPKTSRCILEFLGISIAKWDLAAKDFQVPILNVFGLVIERIRPCEFP